MKIIITEKQCRRVLKKIVEKEVEEQEGSDVASTGASGKQPGNPTKWHDIIKITRGVDNQLQ
jgi:hypothetical protein